MMNPILLDNITIKNVILSNVTFILNLKIYLLKFMVIELMVECLTKYFPKGTKFTYPDGGLFTWAQLPGGLNTTELLQEAVTRKDVKVSYVAGEKFFPDGAPVTNCMRISFGAVPPEKIRVATERLGRMFCENLK